MIPGLITPRLMKNWIGSSIGQGEGTVFTVGVNHDYGLPASNLFNGNSSEAYNIGYRFRYTDVAIVGKEWAAPRIPRAMAIFKTTYPSWSLDASANITLEWWVKNGLPSSATDGTMVAATPAFAYNDAATYKGIGPLEPGIGYTHWWLRPRYGAGGSLALSEIIFEEWK